MPGKRLSGGLLLFIVLAVALGWRLNNLGFGLPSLYDPDEPIFMLKGLELIQKGTLNPEWFGHPGTTTIYLLAVVDVLVVGLAVATGRYPDVASFVQAAYADPGLLFVPARLTMVVIATLSVALTYVLGRRLAGPVAGLTAAALLALNGLHIAWSQVVRTDIHASVFMLLAMLFALYYSSSGRWRSLVFASLFTGFAIATKWPAASVFIAVVGAEAYRLLHGRSSGRQLVVRLTAAAACVLLGMFVASPYLFIDWPTVVSNLSGESRPFHLGHTGEGFFSNLSIYLGKEVAGSMGWIGLAFALIGALLASRGRHVALFVLLAPATAFLIMISGQKLVWSRWVLPLLPMLCILAGMTVQWLTDQVGERARRLPPALVGASLAFVLLLPSFFGARAQAAERANDTRAQARAWAIQHIPPGSTVVLEHLELALRTQPWRFLFPIGESGCLDALNLLERNLGYEELQKQRDGGPIVDLGNVATSKINSCRADFAILTYYDLYVEEAERFPDAMSNYRTLLRGGRTVALFRPVPGRAGGPTVRIVLLKQQ